MLPMLPINHKHYIDITPAKIQTVTQTNKQPNKNYGPRPTFFYILAIIITGQDVYICKMYVDSDEADDIVIVITVSLPSLHSLPACFPSQYVLFPYKGLAGGVSEEPSLHSESGRVLF